MLVKIGEFKKKDGSLRTMKFVKISDLSEDHKEKLGLTKDKESNKKKLAEGSEMVYDVEAKGFRVFNWNTVIDEVLEEEMEVEL